jgi:hypothetical protein
MSELLKGAYSEQFHSDLSEANSAMINVYNLTSRYMSPGMRKFEDHPTLTAIMDQMQVPILLILRLIADADDVTSEPISDSGQMTMAELNT